MKSMHAIHQEIGHYQRQARENFAQSQVKDQLVMQQAMCELDKSPALKDYESRTWPVRQYRNWCADGFARRDEGVQRSAAQKVLRGLLHADVLTLTAAKSAIKSNAQHARSSYYQRVAHITESEITRIAREQFFINKVEDDARGGFVAAYDALVQDLGELPHDTAEALSTLTERLQELDCLNDDNRREFATQLGGTLATKSAEISFALQSLHQAYGCAHACLHQMPDASIDDLTQIRDNIARLQQQLESGTWHPSIPARAHQAWSKAGARPSGREEEMFGLLSSASRQTLLSPAAFVLTHVHREVTLLVDAESKLRAAAALHRETSARSDIEALLFDTIDSLGGLVEQPAGDNLDAWFTRAHSAYLPGHRRRAQHALAGAIILIRTQSIGYDVDKLTLPGMLDPVAPQVLFDVRDLRHAIATLRRTPVHRVPTAADALDCMEAKLLKVAARAATSVTQIRLQDAIPQVVAADYRYVEQGLFGASGAVRALLGDFIDTEWDVRAHYMRLLEQPQTVENLIINGESFLEDYYERAPELYDLAKDRYAQALSKHMHAHPEDREARNALIARYGYGLGGSQGFF